MEPVRVHIAVLSVTSPYANTVAMENLVADRAMGAGHTLSAFEAVRDSEIAIRSQLVGWIEDPEVDVVVVVGEGMATPRALQPLVDQPMRDLAEKIQTLAQEVTGAKVASTAEVARCGSTFVFVLPGSEVAVRVAMDMVILPQLDPTTQPRNLIGSMPRLRHDADVTKVDVSSVPSEIPVEKTASGSGMPARLPAVVRNAGNAQPVLQRSKSRTGGDLVRKPEDPTRPIELQRLEEQIVLSKSNEPTKRVELVEGAVPEAARPTQPVIELTKEKPIPLTKLKSVPQSAEPDELPKAVELSTRSTPKPLELVKPEPKPLELVKPSKPVSKPLELVKPVSKPLELLKPVESKPVSKPLELVRPVEDKPVEDKPVEEKAVEIAKPVDVPAIAAAAGKLPDLPPGASGELVSLDELLVPEPPPEPRKPARTRPPTPPPPPPVEPEPRKPARTRPPTPPPPARVRPPSNLPIAPVDLPVPPSATSVISDLPSGAFQYPTLERRSKAPLVLLLLLILAGAAVAIFVVTREEKKDEKVAQTKPAVDAAQATEPPADAAEVAVVEADAADVVEPDAALAIVTPDAAPKKPDRGKKPPKPPVVAEVKPKPDPRPDPKPPDPKPDPRPDPQPGGDSGCEEVACVVEKYARPCCARWKPKDVFTPTVGTTENLEKPQIKAGVDRVRPRIIACAEQSTAKGTVRVSVNVDPEGNVTGVDVQDAPDPALGNCVAGALRKAHFAKTVNGGQFTYPFVF